MPTRTQTFFVNGNRTGVSDLTWPSQTADVQEDRAARLGRVRTPLLADTVAACESSESWTHGGSNTIDANTYKFGAGSLKLVNGGTDPWSTLPLDIPSWGSIIQFWVYLSSSSDTSAYSFLEVQFRVDASNYFSKNFASASSDQVYDRWQAYSFELSGFNTTGSPSWDNVTDVRLRVRRNPGTATVYVDGITTVDTTPGVSLYFDDGHESVYTLAFPILRKYGVRATVPAISSLVGTSGYMSWDQLRDLQSEGWSIVNHSADEVSLSSLSEADLRMKIETCRTALIDNGFVRGADFLVCPGGNSSNTVRKVASEKHVYIREGSTSPYTHPYRFSQAVAGSDFAAGMYYSIDNRTWATVETQVDTAVAVPSVADLTVHKVAGTAAALTTSTTVLESLCAKMVDEGLPDLTLNDMFDPVA